MAEGLGTGLQNLLQQFESAWHLQKKSSRKRALFFLRLFGDITRGFICCKYFKNVRFFVFFVYVCNLSTIATKLFLTTTNTKL